MGTPQNLDELVLQLMLIPVSQFKDRAPDLIRDYLAQSFGAAMLETDPALETALLELFEQLLRRA